MDAENFKAFVEDELIVPEGKTKSIKFLSDGDATKEKVLAALKTLYAPETPINKGDLVFIFYAGHGARGDPPEGWIPRGTTGDKTIEMICPVDIKKEVNGKTITGIPDVILGTIITKISEKSDNIVSLPTDLFVSAKF